LLNQNYVEAYLQRALFENNKTKINENITKYLNSNNALHKEYANNYLNNTLTQSLSKNTKEIAMVPKVYFLYDSGDGLPNSPYYEKSEVHGKQLANEITEAISANNKDIQVISLPKAATESFNTKNNYLNVLNTIFLARCDENEGYSVVHYYKELENEDYTGKLDLFRLDPKVWEFFKTNQIEL
jgi:hypothetical protein